MKLGVYARSDGAEPLVLVADCLQPSIEAQHLYGQLHFRGTVDTDQLTLGIDWAPLHDAILNASYATVYLPAARQVLAALDIQGEMPGGAWPDRAAFGG